MSETMIVLGIAIGLISGFLIAYFAGNKIAAAKITEAEERKKLILDEADKESKAIKKEKMLEAKEEWHRRKQEFESESQSKRNKLQAQEKQLKQREEGVANKLELISRKEKTVQVSEKELQTKREQITKLEKEIQQRRNDIEQIVQEQTMRLERITGMSRDDAKKYLIENMLNDARSEAAQLVKDIRDEAKTTAQKEAQKIVIQAIQRTASDHSVETTVSVVNLASEEMKGRIIGREGRNIRAFESATGIDLIIDDTPEAVVISGFDPFRREVARVALDRLMSDGRIHPARIEEVVEKTRKELEDELAKIGENAMLELGIHNIHPELVKYIGRMKYRSSYGQNLLAHSIEVGFLCGVMASELGLDVHQAKRAGLLHDIGKCVDKSIEGPHALLGMDLCKKYKEHPLICNAVGAHHDDIEMESAIAVLVQSADSISGARPGARRESVENYIKRLEKLEEIAMSFDGVTKTYAIQAGREIRVLVEPERVDDLLADSLAHNIAGRIENEMEYPGQIRVTVIRERRSSALAK
ncbi:MAG TPA: ribonuclease Y [Candidatus Kapabacteria bacterium]|jgi:ribonuclease Y|nr:ribonuclease Y [Candidatus Kapabacteria bacterium]HRI29882.1 ribonuclease Y [Candidatus Kapabacteria bacterium]HRK58004.1 ribonuclease Y [Candidatus Kapabacteria bacterium]